MALHNSHSEIGSTNLGLSANLPGQILNSDITSSVWGYSEFTCLANQNIDPKVGYPKLGRDLVQLPWNALQNHTQWLEEIRMLEQLHYLGFNTLYL